MRKGLTGAVIGRVILLGMLTRAVRSNRPTAGQSACLPEAVGKYTRLLARLTSCVSFFTVLVTKLSNTKFCETRCEL